MPDQQVDDLTNIESLMSIDNNPDEITTALERKQADTAMQQYTLSTNDVTAGKQLCATYIQDVLKLKLPKQVMKRPEIAQLVGMHAALEKFTLQSMFTVVASSINLLTDLSAQDCYDTNGQFDSFRLQAILNTQQHVMQVIAAFNTHCRRLPIVMQDMLRDLEVFQIVDISNNQQSEQKTADHSFVTATPMASFLNASIAKHTVNDVEHEVVEEPAVEPDIESDVKGPNSIEEDEILEEV
jgi:hypothetical protein